MTPGADPVHKVTIIPRGMALGLTMQLPEDDKHTYTREYLEAMLAVLMGGRSAEEIFLGHITTGDENAKRLLSNNRDTLERIAQALLEREVIDALEVKMLMEGKPLPEKPRTPPTPPPQAAPSADPKVVRPELRPAPGFTRGENPAKA